MRVLKRGTRGEDVLLWQRFLMRQRDNPEFGFSAPAIRLDGIFGRDTARATVAFQQRVQLRADGVVGKDTFLKARELGFLAANTSATQGLEPFAAQLRRETASGIVQPRVEPSGPAPGAGNTRAESFQRLRAESWQASGAVQSGLVGGQAVFQLLKDGAGDYVYDDYSVIVETMPKDRSAEAFLEEMAGDLNRTVGDSAFDTINVFRRRMSGKPTIGEIIDIDILGPDNGSVALVDLQPHYFIFQTVDSDKMGSHPENGCREFGFERVTGGIRFYTRGVSRPGNFIVRIAGSVPQKRGWTRLMLGISNKIVQLGGTSNPGSFQEYKESKPQ